MEDNKVWEETAAISFLQAVAEGNYVHCQEIIGDVSDVNPELGKKMEDIFGNTTIGNFLVASPF